MKKLRPISRALILISAVAIVSAYFVPLWQIVMWAPQYPEGLVMEIWIDNITGDVRIISALNHYIGMRHIEASMFPEFGYMTYIVGAMIGFGILTAIVNRRLMAVLFGCLLLAGGIAALLDLYLWGYDYGHNLDPTAPIVVPGMSYQPPLIGTKQLLNFTAFSGPGIGGWIFIGAAMTAIGTLISELHNSRMEKKALNTALPLLLCFLLIACKVEPQPLYFGKDGCHACKMTLVDNRFGSEILTTKGKVYKFDDVTCMLNFLNSGEVRSNNIQQILIIDFTSPENLIDARNALYLKSESIKSPMASNVAAFESSHDLEKVKTYRDGISLTWDELQSLFQ